MSVMSRLTRLFSVGALDHAAAEDRWDFSRPSRGKSKLIAVTARSAGPIHAGA